MNSVSRLARALMLAAAGALVAGSIGASASTQPTVTMVGDGALQALSTTVGGASPLATTRTVAHWSGSSLDPHNGVTYGYNMVGANPNSCTGSACSATIEADITPVVVRLHGMTFDPTVVPSGESQSVLAATLASPQFAPNDYGSTSGATVPGDGTTTATLSEGPGGPLSQNDAGHPAQLEDATMRAQFNKTGASGYHLILHPNILPTVTIDVPDSQGVLLERSTTGVIVADIDITWWSTRIQQLNSTANPAHLPIWLTNDVLLHIGPNVLNCCVIGFHGASEVVGHGTGNTHGNGNQPVQTYAWASWVKPGFYARQSYASDGTPLAGFHDWALQDIHALSHEISEWADDPFINNKVEPWLTPTAPQYGCTGLLETGDPVVGIGFSIGTNTFEQSPTNPNGTPSAADGTYHPEDETYLQWFMRTAPNTTSEPTQSPSTNIGRYTLMGDLNPFSGFRAPATGC